LRDKGAPHFPVRKLNIGLCHAPSVGVESPELADTVEKLDFLPRSQFLRQQAGFKNKALRVFGRRADFSVCGGRSELAMATRGAICPA
jgi:hypothetical protein